MIARLVVLAAALLVTAPQALAATPSDLLHAGAVALMTFDGDPRNAPSVQAASGWTCTGPAYADGLWGVDCEPTPLAADLGLGAPTVCAQAFVVAGGTPVTIGRVEARVSCASQSHEVRCASSWTGWGQCAVTLQDHDAFPLRCRANVTGAIVGAGHLYATCGNGVAR